MNEPIYQSTIQSINQSINQPTKLLVSQPTNQSINHPTNPLVSQPTNQSTNQPTNHPPNQPLTNHRSIHLINQSPNQPTNQSFNQPTNQPKLFFSTLADSQPELSALVEDKEVAARAVAFVVNSTRKGIVPLCADIANLLRAKRRSVLHKPCNAAMLKRF